MHDEPDLGAHLQSCRRVGYLIPSIGWFVGRNVAVGQGSPQVAHTVKQQIKEHTTNFFTLISL